MPGYCFVRPENAGWTFLSDIAVMGKNAHPTLKSSLDRALACTAHHASWRGGDFFVF